MTVLSGSIRELGAVDARSLACLIASGLATGASWLCYFKALQLGDVSRVTPVDKMSTVLTVIMAVALLGEDPRRPGRPRTGPGHCRHAPHAAR